MMVTGHRVKNVHESPAHLTRFDHRRRAKLARFLLEGGAMADNTSLRAKVLGWRLITILATASAGCGASAIGPGTGGSGGSAGSAGQTGGGSGAGGGGGNG